MSLLISGLNLPNDKPVTLFISSNRNVYLEGVLLSGKAVSIPARDVWKAIGQKPLFGHHSGKKSTTFWGCFMKGIV